MNKKLIFLIILICILGAAIVFLVKHKFLAPETAEAIPAVEIQTTEQAAAAVVYTYYAGTYLSLDKDWTVCANSSGRPGGIPEISGVGFTRLIYGKRAEPEEEADLEYVMRVALDLQKHGMQADKIIWKNRLVTVEMGNLKIELGKNDKTDDKINDLSDFIDMVNGLHGTLYMQNGNANNYGYTFRADEDNK